MVVIKRDGRKVEFDSSKISCAIYRAANQCNIDISNEDISMIVNNVIELINFDKEAKAFTVEEIQNLVDSELHKYNKDLQIAYSSYREERTKTRELKSDVMKAVSAIGVETDRDNANVGNNFSSKLLRIASETNKYHNLAKMPKHLAKLHENGDLYYHDLDSFNLTTNCLHIDTGKVLNKGFNTGYGTINKPKRISSAAELSCILLQSTQNK